MEARKLYYAGLKLEEDLAMCKVFDELEANPDVKILSHGRKNEIIECGRDRWGELKETGAKHLGFEYHYINIQYRGFVFSIEPATYYPFTDENHPGPINFVPYLIRDENHIAQCGYAFRYDNIESINEWIRTAVPRPFYEKGRIFEKRVDYKLEIAKEIK